MKLGSCSDRTVGKQPRMKAVKSIGKMREIGDLRKWMCSIEGDQAFAPFSGVAPNPYLSLTWKSFKSKLFEGIS